MFKIDKILLHCSDFVNSLRKCPKGFLLYRGSHLQIGDYKLFESRLRNRRPVNTPQHLHDKVNEIFEPKFGWKIRNGVFCYGFTSLNDVPDELGYGKQYLCFPIGNFSFVFSPDHFDLCGHFHEMNYSVNDEHINNLVFRDDSIREAIDSFKYRNGLSNEISINVPTYYLIDVKHRDTIAQIIWA